MERPETTRAESRQPRESIVALEKRIVRKDRRLALDQLRRDGRTSFVERTRRRGAAPLLQPRRHPQALALNRRGCSPVNRRGAGAQRLVDTVTVSDLFDERESVVELESYFLSRDSVPRGGIRRARAAHGMLAHRGARGLDAAAIEQPDQGLHPLAKVWDVLRLRGLRDRGVAERRGVLGRSEAAESRRPSIAAEPSAEELPHDRDRTTGLEDE